MTEKFIENMNEWEKRCITPEKICQDFYEKKISYGNAVEQIKYLITQETVLFSEKDFNEIYNEAKEYWEVGGGTVRGCSEEIKECIWNSFVYCGYDIKSKKVLLKTRKNSVNLDEVMNRLHYECTG